MRHVNSNFSPVETCKYSIPAQVLVEFPQILVWAEAAGDELRLYCELEDAQGKIEELEASEVVLAAYEEFFKDCFSKLAGHYPCPAVTSDYDKSVIFDAITAGEEAKGIIRELEDKVLEINLKWARTDDELQNTKAELEALKSDLSSLRGG